MPFGLSRMPPIGASLSEVNFTTKPRPKGFDDARKRLVGQQEGLTNPRMLAKKDAQEKALKDELAKKTELQKLYAPAWEQIEKAYAELPKMSNRLAFSNLSPSRLATIAQ